MPLSHPQPPTLTPREERQRKWDERRAESWESPDAQESTESEKEKEEKSPHHPKKCKNKKPKVIKGKEYKIQQPKKEPPSGNVPYVQKISVPKKSSMITLQYITSTSFYVVIESVARLLGVHNPLKSTNSAMEKWHFCVKYAEQSSLLPQTCLITKPCICKNKILFVHIQNAVGNIKQSQSLIAIITTDTNKHHPRQPSIDVLFVRKHFKEPNI